MCQGDGSSDTDPMTYENRPRDMIRTNIQFDQFVYQILTALRD